MRLLTCILLLPGLAVVPAPAAAIDAARLHMAAMQGEGWALFDVSLQARLPGAAADKAVLSIARLRLPEPIGELHDLRLTCPHLQLSPQRIVCQHGSLRAKGEWLQSKAMTAGFTYTPGQGRFAWHIQGLPMFGGAVDAKGAFTGAGWTLQLQGHVNAASSLPLLAAWPQLPQLDGSGQLKIKADISGGTTLTGQLQVTASALTFSDKQGRYASDHLGARLAANFSGAAPHWQLQGTLTADAGQLYVQPIFLDAGKAPLQLSVSAVVDGDSLNLSQVKLQQQQGLQLTGTATWQLNHPDTPLRSADIQIEQAQMPLAFSTWLQPFMVGTALAQWQTRGVLKGGFQWRDGKPQQLQLTLHDTAITDAAGHYAIDGINGQLHWRAGNPGDGAVQASQLHWSGGRFYRLPVGAGGLNFSMQGRNVRLLQPLRLPLAGGAVVAQRFAASQLGGADMQLAFNGQVEQLDLSKLGKALGWPQFGGTLSGQLPQLSYADRTLTLGGTLSAQVFGGTVRISDFRLDNPFGALPRLGATLHARNLDLEKITQAFSFGRIEGRLNVDVENLRMLNWQPVSFNARLYTPPGDDSRHRINQQAVDKLASIGSGGATSILSGTFLRFFDSFRYQKLGLGCVLANGVCQMNGIAPHDGGGYYIVKGSGLPRINVIGFVNRVQWKTLVEQLKAASEGGAPVVK